MISEQEQARIRLISDNELYPQAVEFMKNMGRPLPSTQINGLLNVSLANTYQQLALFVKHQGARKTWRGSERHVEEFYRTKFPAKLKQLETYLPAVTCSRAEKASREDEQAIKMELAREFIQHLLAENAYKEAMGGFEFRQEAPRGNQGSFRGEQRR
ncbi:MAG TPA: hypothetical protein VGD98_01845 [Ktedonobacteraceae bacterium]